MKNNIKKIVEEYLTYYPNEIGNMSKLIKLLDHSPSNLFNRKNFEGHITASGFIYCLSENKLLLLEHKALNKLLQPGGHVEKKDDDIISAARREIFEETGILHMKNLNISDDINVPFDINSHYIPNNKNKNEEEHYHHDFRYLFVIKELEEVKIDQKESNNYKWIDINNLLNDESFGLTIKKIVKLIEKNKEKY